MDTTSLSDGNYFVDVNMFTFATLDLSDMNIVTDSSDANFYVDNTNAAITIISPSSGETIPVNTTTVTMVYTTSETDIAEYYVKLNAGEEISNGTNTSYTFTGLSGGTNTVYVKARDNLDNNSSFSSVTFQVVISSGGSSIPVSSASKSIIINAGSERNIPFPSALSTISIRIIASKEISGTLEVDEDPEESEGLVLPEINYKLIKITLDEPSDSVESAVIRFSVLKSWLTENEVNENNVSLYRFVDGSWVELETKRVGTVLNNPIYEAVSPGFSLFLVAESGLGSLETEPEIIEVPVEEDTAPLIDENLAVTGQEIGSPEPVVEPLPEVVPEQTNKTISEPALETDTSEIEESEDSLLWPILLALVIVLLIGGGVALLLGKKNKNPLTYKE